jgi:hypothetical protein
LQKKEVAKKSYEDKGRLQTIDEGPLDDPIAEKLRQQRCFFLSRITHHFLRPCIILGLLGPAHMRTLLTDDLQG